MARNALEWVGTTWLIPVRTIEHGNRVAVKSAITAGANGTGFNVADRWIQDYYLPSSVKLTGGSAVFWQLNGKGRGDKNTSANNTFINNQIRSWCQAIMNFQHSVFAGRTWDWYIDNGVTWGELEWSVVNGPMEDQMLSPFRQLDAMGLLDRLQAQQTLPISDILNQLIHNWTPEQWDNAVKQKPEEPEEEP